MASLNTNVDLSAEIVGHNTIVPVIDGRVRYVNLDNAASTPPLRAVQQAVDRFATWYASVHRGSGYKSRVSTHAYEAARIAVAEFVGIDPARQTVIFVKHTTEGLNRVAHSLTPDTIVFTSIMEHHAAMLPWRERGLEVQYIAADADGVIDRQHLEALLRAAPGGRPKLVAIAGAYNVSGCTPPIHELARLAHQHRARILIDGAQLVPHQPVCVRGTCTDDALDYLVFSGHKLYAPYGSGVLIAPNDVLLGAPAMVGGGTVDLVTLDEVQWADLPDREEAGSPNVMGVVALHAAIQRLQQLGMPSVAAHERALTEYTLARLAELPGVRVLGPATACDRLGTITFTVGNVPPFLVAAILACEWGVAVRAGCFCAHPAMMHLLDLSATERAALQARVRAHDKLDIPGGVRASLALYNTRADVDALIDGLQAILAGRWQGTYRADPTSGEYEPVGWSPRLDAAFSVAGPGPDILLETVLQMPAVMGMPA
ncbi:MAG: aminotransferase class V-fold PLP-dependent enzyme [Chloroflexi bacterium]|nr:aminotransferase class V-fold PLP-dependent enzyme [Chloroflexota bacterium]